MNQYIDHVVAEDVQFSELVIEGKGEIYNSPGFEELFNWKIICNISNSLIYNNLGCIIKDKRTVVDVAVDYSSNKRNQD